MAGKTPSATPEGTAKARRSQYGRGVSERGRRMRALLLASARQVFERDGYLDARVADIVQLAGVSHGTFYTYFDSKLEVFRALINEVSEEVVDALTVPLGGDSDTSTSDFAARLDLSNRRFLDVYRKNHAMLRLMEQVATIDPQVGEQRVFHRRVHVERISASIRKLQGRGLVDRDLDARTAAAALAAMVGNFAYYWFAMGEPFDEELAKATLHRMWLGAIGYHDAR
ncbi:TetR/AcrR family transcriptional regulator [Nonomuraea lactucae]|uniref:TetR/AcrR family transcriptional regulator n=1 Tax=Nonomuraea lactucae TaxID=2249762 RepID=UPI000DE3EC31|nr:TetR/AcrR family transcriptional regulator [Nonomuraea lactucae]